MFSVRLDSQPERFLKKADKAILIRVCKKIDALKNEPIPHDAKRVVNRKEKTFRVRVGEYRILYVVYVEDCTILISRIDKRSRAYMKR